VRYQRATKAKTGAKRPPAERRNSPPVRGPLPKQARSGPASGGRGGRGGGRGPPGYGGGRGVGRPWGPPGAAMYSDEEGGLAHDGGEDGEGDGDLGSGDRGRDASPPGRRVRGGGSPAPSGGCVPAPGPGGEEQQS
jgi:translation initiation factor IF-2